MAEFTKEEEFRIKALGLAIKRANAFTISPKSTTSKTVESLTDKYYKYLSTGQWT